MLDPNQLQAAVAAGRSQAMAVRGDPNLGTLGGLPGTWANQDELAGHGWNMIALPYVNPGSPVTPQQPSDFRLLLNQFDETLIFSMVDNNVPNRGAATQVLFDADQHVAALQYIQNIVQSAAADFPPTPNTNDTPKGTAGIHHEPGLMLHMLSQTGNGPDLARLATIPHGNSVNALGHGVVIQGPPDFTSIGDFSALPIGVSPDVDNDPYLLPYKTFRDAPFQGLFNPVDPLDLLRKAVPPNVKTTTVLTFDTTLSTGGITSIPFVVSQANASAMRAVFWIEELDAPPVNGIPQMVLQYAQRVILEFFTVPGDPKTLIQWPHITINTMKLVALPPGG
jgi:hypothetical protein